MVCVSIAFGMYHTASADDAAKPLVLEKSGPERQLPERLLGASVESLIEHLIDDPRKVAALKDMDLAFVRFPGGSQSNYYDWRTGLLDIPVTPRSSAYMRFWADIAPKIRTGFPNGVKIAEYTKFARQIGAEVVLVPNLETLSIAEQVAWFREMQAAGIVPRYIELGNEFWIAMGFDPDVLKRWPDEPTAMRIMKQYCDALRPYFLRGPVWPCRARPAPSGFVATRFVPPVSICGSGIWTSSPPSWFDAVTIHPYPRMDTIMGERGRRRAGISRKKRCGCSVPSWPISTRAPTTSSRTCGSVCRARKFGSPNGTPVGPTTRSRMSPPRPCTSNSPPRMTFALLRHREVTMSLFFTLNFLRHGPAGGAFQSDGQGGYRPMPHVLALRWFHEAANGGGRPTSGSWRQGLSGSRAAGPWPKATSRWRRPCSASRIWSRSSSRTARPGAGCFGCRSRSPSRPRHWSKPLPRPT